MLKIVDNYTLTDYLGKGEYGKVYKAINIDTKFDVAIKMIPLSKFSEINRLVELTKNQLRILKILEDNINIINFVEMIKTNRYIYLVYEFCEGGTLEDLIHQRGYIPEKEALRIFKQLLNAFKSMHEANILHRDIKPNNIFFKSGHLKLADFGFCKQLKNHDDLTQTSLGSPLYMAPEILNGDVYGSKADIWSLGIVLYQMLFGRCPYGDCNIKQLISNYNNQRMKLPMSDGKIFISPTTENMLRRMLQKDQFKRISWQDFFYEYEIDEYGGIKKKQKDFQYDLMKLMKKNSSTKTSQKTNISEKSIPSMKFDWSKITQKNSSVHSEELNHTKQMDSDQINEICTLKKKVKEFQIEHEKSLQISGILQEILVKEDFYSPAICYILVLNLHNLISQSYEQIQKFILENKQILARCPQETDSLNKMTVVFRNESQNLTSKINSIKISLMTSQGFQYDLLQYPQKSILSREVNRYLKKIEGQNKGILEFGLLNYEGNRNTVIFLMRVLWGLACGKDLRKNKEINMLSIKPDMTFKDLSTLLNKLIVFIL